MRSDEAAPLLEVGGAAKMDGVILDGLPLHHQAVARRNLDGAVELNTVAALSALKQGYRLFNTRFERGLLAWFDFDLCDFPEHPESPWAVNSGTFRIIALNGLIAIYLSPGAPITRPHLGVLPALRGLGISLLPGRGRVADTRPGSWRVPRRQSACRDIGRFRGMRP